MLRRCAIPLLFMAIFSAGCAQPCRRDISISCLGAARSIRLMSRPAGMPLSAERELRAGEAVLPNDQITLQIALSQMAFLYAVWYAPAGESELLFPQIQRDIR